MGTSMDEWSVMSEKATDIRSKSALDATNGRSSPAEVVI